MHCQLQKDLILNAWLTKEQCHYFYERHHQDGGKQIICRKNSLESEKLLLACKTTKVRKKCCTKTYSFAAKSTSDKPPSSCHMQGRIQGGATGAQAPVKIPNIWFSCMLADLDEALKIITT